MKLVKDSMLIRGMTKLYYRGGCKIRLTNPGYDFELSLKSTF